MQDANESTYTALKPSPIFIVDSMEQIQPLCHLLDEITENKWLYKLRRSLELHTVAGKRGDVTWACTSANDSLGKNKFL